MNWAGISGWTEGSHLSGATAGIKIGLGPRPAGHGGRPTNQSLTGGRRHGYRTISTTAVFSGAGTAHRPALRIRLPADAHRRGPHTGTSWRPEALRMVRRQPRRHRRPVLEVRARTRQAAPRL